MSSIDEVIARSRQKGTFTERKTFTVARQSAIQKMRKFALADPHYYVLELIQSAIANGATYVDLDIRSRAVRLSYVGGGFSESELSQLFDFLFASKDDLDIADVRQLALGINALLLATPDTITIESGDGTLEGTTRVEIHTVDDEVIVGRPEQPLKGTYVSVSGLRRGGFKAGGELRELQVIENRCLSATIPIIVNTDPVFGYTTQRVPQLFGYPRSIEFDEGDLYGSIGIATTAYSENFKLLTWGVWVESVKFDLLPGHRLGGIIAFDRLRKTADHASIVQDEVFQEMWTRLRPYARQLASGKTGSATFNITLLDSDEKLTATQIRELIDEAGGAISLNATDVRAREKREMARQLADMLELPLFVTSSEDSSTIQLLAGDHFYLRPELTSFELEFYSRELAEAPPRPWVIGAQEFEPITIAKLGEWLGESNGLLSMVPEATLTLWLGDRNGELRATIYTPEDRSGATSLEAEVRTAGRTVWRGDINSGFPGHSLVIEMPSSSPTTLSYLHNGKLIAQHVAEQVALHATGKLEDATKLALSTLDQRDPEPDSALARITLGALARGTMKRLRTDEQGRQRVVFTVLSNDLDERALRVPLVRTHDGRAVTGHDLEDMLERQHGLIYGTVPEVDADLEGIDPSTVLALDLASERMIVSLVGEGSYIRIDARDELVHIDTHQIRDLYIPPGDEPAALLTEGRTSPNATVEEHLVQRLMHIFLGSFPEAERDIELRRQASRHLVWYFARTLAAGLEPPKWLLELPMFRAADGSTVCARQFLESFEAGELRMADGWSVDCADLAELGTQGDPDAVCDTLAMNPFVYHALRAAHPVHPTMDYPVGREIDYDGYEMLVETTFEDPRGVGKLGIPLELAGRPAIALVDSQNSTVGTIESLAARFGVIGIVHLTARGSNETDFLAQNLAVACRGLMRKLMNVITTRDSSAAHQIHLLDYAGGGITFTRQPWGEVELDVGDVLTAEILELPIFPTQHGVAVAAYRFLREFAMHGDEEVEGRAKLADDAPEHLKRWLDEQLDPARIHSPASNQVKQAEKVFSAEGTTSADDLAWWLATTLTNLRPDNLPGPQVMVHFVTPNEEGRVLLPEIGPARIGTEAMVGYVDWNAQRIIYFNTEHPVVAAALDTPTDQQRRVWLLLSAYARINYDYVDVTNRHELEFQSRVLSLL